MRTSSTRTLAVALFVLGAAALSRPASAQQNDNARQPALRISGAQIILMRPVGFESGAERLTAEGEVVLEQLRQLLLSTPSIGRIRIDYRSNDDSASARSLARRRVARIRQRLVDSGIRASRVEVNVTESVASSSTSRVRIWIVG